MKISLCYIVKDEEKNLPVSIESCKAVCDEIIVVDTGSTDGTVAYAKSVGAKVLHFKWRNDFSKARNFAISSANGDAIIFLDADEWFEPALTMEHRSVLEDLLSQGHTAFCVDFINMTGKNIHAKITLPRIFKNFAGIRYVNAIHEHLNCSKTYQLPPLFTLYHSGYMPQVNTKKQLRNIEIIEEELKTCEPAKRPNLLYYAARESRALGREKEARKYIEEFLALADEAGCEKSFLLAALTLYVKIALNDHDIPNAKIEARLAQMSKHFSFHPVCAIMHALYYFERTGDFSRALEQINAKDRLEREYRPEMLPHDFTTVGEETLRLFLIRGVIAETRGDSLTALDAYCEGLKAGFNTELFRRLVHLIQDQPANDVISFLSMLNKNALETELEQVLNVLRGFPKLRQVFLYYANWHLKQTGKHSDITALAAVFGGMYDHALAVARTLFEQDPSAARCLAAVCAICSDTKVDFDLGPLKSVIDRCIEGELVASLSKEEFAGLMAMYGSVRFCAEPHIKRKLDGALKQLPYELFILNSQVCMQNFDFTTIIEFARPLFEAQLSDSRQCEFLFIAGTAFSQLKMFDKAIECFSKIRSFTQRSVLVRRELNIIAALSPEHAGRALELAAKIRD